MLLAYLCAPRGAARPALIAQAIAFRDAGKIPIAWQLATAGVWATNADALEIVIPALVRACDEVFVARGADPHDDPTVRVAMQAAIAAGKRVEWES